MSIGVEFVRARSGLDQTRQFAERRPLPVLASERISATSVGMSQRCQKPAFAGMAAFGAKRPFTKMPTSVKCPNAEVPPSLEVLI
jgi:hypothetical protein